MRVTEIFDSIQGEGPAMGLPCTFMRLSGCNLRCAWCDTPQSSWNPQGAEHSIAELVARANISPKRTVVITGGEPFLFAELAALCEALRAAGHAVHLETSGSLFAPVAADLVCLSPKLANSTPDAVLHPEWHVRHERARLPVETLQKFVAHFGEKLYLKFVICSSKDLLEIKDLLSKMEFNGRERVFLMPECRNREELATHAESVALVCVQEGFRYSDRLHVRLWGNESGR